MGRIVKYLTTLITQIAIIDVMDFTEWINKKFLELQNQRGSRMTVVEFAEIIGIKQQTMSGYLNGESRPGSQKNLEKLAAVFGPEVYEVVGKSSTVFNYDPISEAPPEIKSKFSAALAAANQRYREAAEAGTKLSESEAAQILVESMAKYGFSNRSTSTDQPS